MRTCSLCKIAKPVSEYHNHKNGKDGLRSRCKECNRTEARRHYQKNPTPYKTRARTSRKHIAAFARDWLRALKGRMGCCLCGISNPVVLEFHHLNQSQKELAVTTSISKGKATLQRELERCVVVCANCHKLCHAGQATISAEHLCTEKIPVSVRGIDY